MNNRYIYHYNAVQFGQHGSQISKSGVANISFKIKSQENINALKEMISDDHFAASQITSISYLGLDCDDENYDAEKFDQALLINKFYERYPLSEFKNDSERAEALGYFMAGAELQRLGKFIEYNDEDDGDE